MKFKITLLLLVCSFSAYGNPVPDFPFIILTERIEKRVAPDLVKIRFSVVAYSETSSESLQILRDTGSQITELLKKNDVSLSLLESTQIDKRAKRARKDGVYNLNILGYETTQGFKLKLDDLKKYPQLMNELIEIDGVSGIDAFFESSMEEQHKADMIQELSSKARKKADTLAKAQSKTVRGVYGITTEGNFGEAYAVFTLQYEPRVYADVASPSSYGMDLTMMVPEYIEVKQRITVIYELE